MKPNVTKRYQKILIESSTQKAAKVFYEYPEKEFSLSDLAKESGVAKPHIGKIIEKLRKLGFIQVTKLTKIWRIKANQGNWFFIRNKIVYNLNYVYQSGLVEYLIDHYNKPRSIILFGSFRKGEDNSDSDIDIAIEDSRKDYLVIRLGALEDFERMTGRKINLHLFNRKTVDINVFNNIANGILLFGFLEVKP